MCDNWLWVADTTDDMVLIPSGECTMGDSFGEGSSSEQPVHLVGLDSFRMSSHETTNQQYCDYLNSANAQGMITVSDGRVFQAGSGNSYLYCETTSGVDWQWSRIVWNGSTFSVSAGSESHPVTMVSWYGAAAYCNWRSQQDGYELCYDLSSWVCYHIRRGYRLPTEAEWEYAARGGLSDQRFPWGDTISHDQANYRSTSLYGYDVSPTRGLHPMYADGGYPCTAPVGSFPANGYGLYDMAGNVYEWCNDWYSDTYYASSPYGNPKGPSSGIWRVLRGGSWDLGHAADCRVALRGLSVPYDLQNAFGFRVVLDLN
jgi:formylglycine-generating enzyme required for sulfatase activity